MCGTQTCIIILPKGNCQVNVNSETKRPVFGKSIGHSRSIDHTTIPLHDLSSSSIYIDQRILPLLLPALEEILLAADKRNSLLIQKARINVLYNLAEIVWNWNPRRSNVKSSSQPNVFDIPQFQQWLSLREQTTKSWLWSKTEAAQCLQKYVRGWLVRKRVDVQELRQFWKDLAEKDLFTKQIESRTILQQHSTAILGNPRIADGHKMYDANFLRCKMYRRMIVANGINVLEVKGSVSG